MGPRQMAPNPRMEAPIRQECPASSQKEPRTPYQQQVQAPVLPTHSSGIGRGTILTMMKRSQELECKTTTIGCGRGLSTKSQGAPPEAREAPGQDLQDQTWGRSRSCLQKGFEKRRSQSTPQGGAFPSFSGAPLLLLFSWVTSTLGTQQILGEKVGKRMLTEHTSTISPSLVMSLQRKLRPSLLPSPDIWSGTEPSSTS